jgi:hypothetical protein
MRKMTILLAGGVGYVLGARAGRERYEQIRGLAQKVAGNPTVQQTAHKAADAAKDAAPVVKDKVAGAADAAASKVTSSGNDVPQEESSYPNG